ncbi:hypothetical protein H8E77_00080 [bacterium]|nr:hypothetical protein [bacterium]
MRKNSSGLTIKTLIIAIFLIPVNCYWVVSSESVYASGSPACIALFSNVVFTVFILVILNLTLKKFSANFGFTQAELLTVYVMLCMATAISGHGFVQILPPLMGHAFQFATPENEWRELFFTYLPSWLTVSDKNVLKGYYEGDSNVYLLSNIKAWSIPLLWWSALIFAFIFVMFGINIIVRKQWIEKDKLAYPIIQLPLAITRQESSLGIFRNKLLWIGFTIAAGIDILNGLNYIYPTIPRIPVKMRDISYLFSEKPFSAIGWLPISFYPAFIGFAFFIPLDLSFSAWFFYLFYKIQRVIGSVIGLNTLPGFPDNDSQSSGAYLALFVIALWGTKAHLRNIFFSLRNSKADSNLSSYDRNEPTRYWTAIFSLILGILFITFFCLKAGMTLWLILVFFVIYYAIATAITRMRAELGSPIHDLHFVGPDQIITDFAGTRRIGKSDLSMFSLFWFFNRSHYSDIMPQQLEGFKIAERAKIDNKKLLYSMIIAVLVGIPSTFWAVLHLMYKFGATARVMGYHVGPGWESFNRLQRWLTNPTLTDFSVVGFMFWGFLFTLFLMVMRIHFIWWPFHPTGYAIAGSWAMGTIWTPILISWVTKWTIIKYGGLKTHRQAIPFFLGLILGEFMMGSIWSIIGIALNVPTYKIWV